MKIFQKILVFLVLLLVGMGATVEAAKRETQTLTLKNGLGVLLIYDPDVHRDAAALSVGTGSLYDPDNKMGLAHYLEHMLFLGTKKYPEVGSFKKYLAENSGASNAYTGAAITNFFFQVSHEGFEGAVDRFSDFFKAPLFDKTYAKREVNAVNSEHDKNKLNDGWRSTYVISQVSEKGHPIHKFGTGNKETLSGDNRAALQDFYRKYYAASNMKLAILANLPLKEQADLARKYFAGIPNHPVQLPPIDPNFRKPLKDQYRLLKIKMIKDIRSLEVEFPTIRLVDHQASKPASIIGSIIGYEGKGSLLSELKKEGLALGLSAGGGYSHPNINSFSVNVSLTHKGVDQYERVIERIFSYIRMLKEKGIKKYTYDENQTMAQINFDWKDPQEGMGYVAGRSALMQDYKLEDVETLPYLFKKYDPDAYRALLDTLNPGNALVILKTNSVETDRVADFYGTQYSLSEVGGPAFEKLEAPRKVAALYYPEQNPFIPYHLKLTEEKPHRVWDDELARVWFQFDDRFKQPRVYMQFRIETPKVYDTVRNSQLSNLYSAAIAEGLNEIVYPIQIAGLSYGLSVEKKGVVLAIGGYSERVDELLRLVTKSLKKIKIDQEKFGNIKEAMIRGLKNRKLGQAFARGGYYNRLMWLEKQYDEDESLAALEPLTLDDLKEYTQTLYGKIYITGVAHGNWTDGQVRESVQVLLDALQGHPLPKEERFQQEVVQLRPGETYLFSKKVMDNNNSLAYGLEIGKKDFELQAKLQLIASIVESDFYTQMRTNQQLGYIVWSFQQRMEDTLFFRFIIQSAKYSPFELNRRVDKWLSGVGKLFGNLTDEEFERHRAGRIVALEKKGDSIAEVLSDLYYLATQEKEDFDYKNKLVQAVKDVKKEDVVAAAHQYLMNPETPRLVILIRSKNNTEPVPKGVITEVSQFNSGKSTQAKRNVSTGGNL
ncbi:MAG: insulinase family protein [Nitrospinaceae bacterium]